MAVYKGKCPNCGGILLYQDDGITLECDSCGKQYSISDLNQQKNIKVNQYKKYKNIDEDVDVLETNSLWKMDYNELFEKTQIALETNNYFKVYEYCDEILRRDPKNAQAYLYKMLADLEVPNKESLKDLDNTFDSEFDECYENYKLLMRFADDDLKQEINNYNKYIETKLENQNLEEIYEEACYKMDHAKNKGNDQFKIMEHNFQALANEFKELGSYKDSQKRYNACIENYNNLKHKRIIKQSLYFGIPVLSVLIIILAIVFSVKSNNSKYSADFFEVTVTNKINDEITHSPFSPDAYSYKFDISVRNNGDKIAKKLYGMIRVGNTNYNNLFGNEVELMGDLGSHSSLNWSVTLIASDKGNDEGKKIWNSHYEELIIYFRITSIQFEGGRVEKYNNTSFKKIKDADYSYRENIYIRGINLYNQKKYKEALTIFEQIKGYKDTNNYISQCNYKIEEETNHNRLTNILNAKVGDNIKFGEYEQDNNIVNGMEEIDWLVIKKDNNKLTLISQYALDNYSYDGTYYDGTCLWHTSDLREWLNSTFLNTAFNSQINQFLINEKIQPTSEELKYGGQVTNDRVYILSVDEINNLLKNNKTCFLTEYAYKNYTGWWSRNAYWVTRTPKDNNSMEYIDESGNISYDEKMAEEVLAIRPVITLDLNKIQLSEV